MLYIRVLSSHPIAFSDLLTELSMLAAIRRPDGGPRYFFRGQSQHLARRDKSVDYAHDGKADAPQQGGQGPSVDGLSPGKAHWTGHRRVSVKGV